MRFDPSSAAGERCTAGVLFAMPMEADAFERRVTDRHSWRSTGPTFRWGMLHGSGVAWCITGVGGPAAALATRLLIDGHRPAVVISAGFAGGLDPTVPRGAVVRPAAVVSADGGSRLPLVAADAANHLLVSVEEPVVTPPGKRRLATATGATVVDMETHAIATVAAAAGLPCQCVRVISDDATETLPPEVTRLVSPQSAARRFGAVLGALGRRPAAVVDLWRLYEHAVVDGRTLAAALETVILAAAAFPVTGPPRVGPTGRGADPGRAP